MRLITTVVFIFIFTSLSAQQVFAPGSFYYNHLCDRMEIINGTVSNDVFTGYKPYLRSDVVKMAQKSAQSQTLNSETDRVNFTYLFYDNPESSGYYDSVNGILRSFYRQRNAFYHVKVPEFELFLNPVLGFSAGKETAQNPLLYQNTRGIELRGSLAGKVGFYSMIGENQLSVPQYLKTEADSNGSLNGAGFIKPFKNNGYDFFQAKGYFTFKPIKITTIQFGHDRNFIGNGYRSLLLSDFSREYLFLKVQTKVWKFQYTNLFTEFADLTNINGAGTGLKKKFAAIHHLSLNLGNRWNVGLFESVIFNRPNNQFETNYLNPIIFYRAVEHNLNSSDNVLVGADLKYIPVKNLCFYSQLILDEFVKNELIKRTGWWANKWGVQCGLKYLNVAGIKNLDAQLEYNTVRPFTYTHSDLSSNYVHYRQPLAHPLGANFKDFNAIINWQPTFPVVANLVSTWYFKGIDSTSVSANWGGNILRSYNDRARDFGNTISQGIPQKIWFNQITVSWQPWHNLFIDIRMIARVSIEPKTATDYMTTIGLRLNLFTNTPFAFSY